MCTVCVQYEVFKLYKSFACSIFCVEAKLLYPSILKVLLTVVFLLFCLEEVKVKHLWVQTAVTKGHTWFFTIELLHFYSLYRLLHPTYMYKLIVVLSVSVYLPACV